MEELRSTETLDNEIRNDARKKAVRLIQKAEDDAKSLLDGVEKRVGEAVAAARNASQERLSLYKKNMEASLPLEKQRCFVSYIHDSVVDAINEYLDAADEQQRLNIVASLVERAKTVLGEQSVRAQVVGFKKKSAETMLKKAFGKRLLSCETGSEILLVDEAVQGLKRLEGIVLTTEDSQTVCRLTVDEKIKEILDMQNYELASTLFGGRLPE